MALPTSLVDAPSTSRPRCAASANPRAQALGPSGCILCGSPWFSHVYPAHFPWLKRCTQCGLKLAHPQPGDEQLAEIYDADYYRTFGFEPSSAERYRSMKQASFAALLRVAERHFRRGRLLDLGSALGDLIAAARPRGWDAAGVEPNPFAVRRAEELVPGASFAGTLEGLAPTRESFDFVTCIDVIEHLRRPDETLRHVYQILRPGGGVMIVTNDVNSSASKALGPRWVHYHLDHLWYFSRESLAALVRGAGFEIVSLGQARKIFNFSYVLGILAHSPNHRPLQRFARSALRWLPDPFLRMLLPPIQEGLLLLARRPVTSCSE